jgi:hypothetical protein
VHHAEEEQRIYKETIRERLRQQMGLDEGKPTDFPILCFSSDKHSQPNADATESDSSEEAEAVPEPEPEEEDDDEIEEIGGKVPFKKTADYMQAMNTSGYWAVGW